MWNKPDTFFDGIKASIPVVSSVLLLLTSDYALAQSKSQACADSVVSPARLSPEECAALAPSPKTRSMIYQDGVVQVMIEYEMSTRSGGAGEATLIINLAAQPHQDDRHAASSLKRRQRFDCRSGTQAVLEEKAFSRPVARGEIVAHSREPNAIMSKPQKESLDAKIMAVYCGEQA